MGYDKHKRPVLSQRHVWPLHRGNTQGFWDYSNSSPTQNIEASVWTKLENNGLGAQTLKDFALPYHPEIFNTQTNQLDFNNLEIGDTVDLRVIFNITTNVNNQIFRVSQFSGIGEFEYEIPIIAEQQFKNHGTYSVSAFSEFYIGNELTKNNPSEIRFYSDSPAIVEVVGWYIKVSALKRFD